MFIRAIDKCVKEKKKEMRMGVAFFYKVEVLYEVGALLLFRNPGIWLLLGNEAQKRCDHHWLCWHHWKDR